jgi:cytoskeleton protein RodZ
MKGGLIWPRAGSFYGRLISAMEDWQHKRNPEEDEESRGETEIGRFLEQKRKERGLSLEEVEQATKIRKRYLTGLERDNYSILPDAVYARGFLKTYANYLGLDGEALSRQLKSSRKTRRERGINYNSGPESDFEKPLITPSGLRGAQKRMVSTSAIVTLIVAVLALAAVIGALYFVGRGVQVSKEDSPSGKSPLRQEQQNAAGREKASEAGSAKEGAVGSNGTATGDQKPAVAKQSAPPDTLRVLVNVRERPSWILIRTDGTAVYEQVAQPGFSKTFEAEQRLFIKSGDAGAVTVKINGQDVGPLGGAGEIVARNYTLKTAS